MAASAIASLPFISFLSAILLLHLYNAVGTHSGAERASNAFFGGEFFDDEVALIVTYGFRDLEDTLRARRNAEPATFASLLVDSEFSHKNL